MTDEDRKRIRDLISEHRKFIKEITRIGNDEINGLQKMLKDDPDLGHAKEYRLFPYNYSKLSKETRKELAIKCNLEFQNAAFANECKIKTACEREFTAEDILVDNGYGDNDIVILKDDSYDSALIGVSHDNRAVYSYGKMIDWYMTKNNCSVEEAMEWIDNNTIRALPYMGSNSPIILNEFE